MIQSRSKSFSGIIPRARQRGVALLMVLFAFALASILATAILSRQNLFLKKTAVILQQSQAQEYATAVEQFARQILYRDYEEDKRNNEFTDDLKEYWAGNSLIIPFGNAILESQIDDLQARLNLNDIVNNDGTANQFVIKRFKNLFELLEIKELTVEKIQDWIDPDSEAVNGDGGEDNLYLIKDPGYRTANADFQDISELKLVDGVTAEIYQKLLPHVTVLPRGMGGVNINTCSKEVLQSLPPKALDESRVDELVEERSKEPIKKAQEFLALPAWAGSGIQDKEVRVNSEFFQVSTRVTLGDRVSRLVSVFQRDKNGKLTLMSRNFGQKYIITKQSFSLPE
ncbi:MAG: type II secretion system minor pseudopilin GspK [Hahellaceae bacterium]|nr:type II secretion system minor pseudopilin GspK [Hahellaceae bacterium]MCP5170403.1 type II secretion system minor pseudopilin GspK [Hahellaceae bacterium]